MPTTLLPLKPRITTKQENKVLPESKSPAYEQGTTKEKLGKDLPTNYRVDVYETSDGGKG
jgi:hypothetical protein